MKVSIALATYNGRQFLGEQLDSLAHQTVQPFELVVCDDGSTDNTLEIVEQFANKVTFPVRIFCNEVNLKHENNFLKAASLCCGDLIAFCDQDDIWINNKLEICLSEFTDNITMVMHSGKVVDYNLKPQGVNFPNIRRQRIAKPLTVEPYHAAPGFAMVFRSELLQLSEWQDRPQDHLCAERIMGHDHWAYLIASVLGNVVFLPQCLVLHRRHQNNTTGVFDHSTKKYWEDAIYTGYGSYRHLAVSAESYSSYLNHLSKLYSGKTNEAYRRGEAYYHSLAHIYNDRAVLYSNDCHGFNKIFQFMVMLFHGRYKSKNYGGLGKKSLLKDAYSLLSDFVRRTKI